MLTIEEVRRAIAEDGAADWTAEDTPQLRSRAVGGASGLFGLRVDAVVGFRAATAALEDLGPVPPRSIDWRDNAHVSNVKNQGGCGACVAFASCAVIEARLAIDQGATLSLSEGNLFHCHGGDCDAGWPLTAGFDAARGGVGLDSALPWDPNGGCIEVPAVAAVVRYVTHSQGRDRRNAVARGPVLAGMRVMEDFLSYDSGVYRHVVGDDVGTHAVCVVGYDDDGGYWIVKNSWGPGFGEDGFFRIAYGQCGLDGEFQFISPEVALL